MGQGRTIKPRIWTLLNGLLEFSPLDNHMVMDPWKAEHCQAGGWVKVRRREVIVWQSRGDEHYREEAIRRFQVRFPGKKITDRAADLRIMESKNNFTGVLDKGL